MAIRTFGDLKKYLGTLDLEPLIKRLAVWLDEQARAMPAEIVAVKLEWDLVGGESNDEIVGDLMGYKAPGLDPESSESWDWSSETAEQFLFLGMGAIWSQAVETVTDDEVPDTEEAITRTIGEVVNLAVEQSREFTRRRHEPAGFRFFWSRRGEPAEEYGA